MAKKQYEADLKIKVDNKELKAAAKQSQRLNRQISKTSQTTSRLMIEQQKMTKGTAQAGKNATTNFAKQAQGMGGLVHVYATVAANVWALSAAFEVLKKASDITIMAQASADLSKKTGISYAAVAQSMKEVTGGALSFTEAMRSANLAISGGASFSEVEEVTKIATKAANALGLSVPNAVNRMIQAVTKGEPELVDELGIILRVTKATEDYAAAHNLVATQLTTSQKQQAILNQLLTQGEEKFGAATPRANPYAKLAASVDELVISGLKLLSTVLEPIVNFIQASSSLLLVGFLGVAKSLIGLILPSLITTAAAQGELATKQSVASAASAKAAREYAQLLKSIRIELEANLRTQQKLSKATTSGQFFNALQKKEGSTLFDSLDKRKGLGFELTSVIHKGLASGLSKDEIFKTVKKSGVLRSIQQAIAAGDTSIFKSSAIEGKNKKFVQGLLSSAGEDIEEAIKFDRTQSGTEKLQSEEKAALKDVETRALQRNIDRRKTAFEVGRASILQHNQLAGSWGVLSTAVRRTTLAYGLGTKNLSLYQKALLKVGLAARVAKLGMSSLIQMGGAVVNKLFSIFAIVSLLGGAFKFLVGVMGFTTKEFSNASSVISKASDEVNNAEFLFGSFAHTMSSVTETLTQATQKWVKIGNVIDTTANQISKLVKVQQDADNATFLDKLIAMDFDASDTSLAGIIKGFSIIRRLSVDQSKFKPTVVFDVFSEKDTKQLAIIVDLRRQYAEQNQKENIAARTGFLIGLDKEVAAMVRIREETEVLELGNLSKLKAQMDRIRLSGADVSKIFDKSIEKAAELTKTVVNAMATATTTSQQIDRQITKMINQSESRRGFTIDSTINTRDRIKDLEDSFRIMKEFESSMGSLLATFTAQGESFKKAYFPGLEDAIKALKLADAAKLIAARFEDVRKALDIDIDLVRNLAKELKILSSQAGEFKRDQKRGDLTTFQSLFANTDNALGKSIAAKRSEINLVIKDVELFYAKDKSAKILAVRLLKEELRVLINKRDLLNESTPGLQRELAELDRIQKIRASELAVLQSIVTLEKERVVGATKHASTLNFAVKGLQKQFDIAIKTNNLEVKIIADKRKELLIQKELKDSKTEYASIVILDNKLAVLNNKEAVTKLKFLQEQLKIEKELFEMKNRQDSQSAGGALANSFKGAQDPKFWENVAGKFQLIADEMNLTVNAVTTMAEIIQGAVVTFNDTIVQSLLSRTWDGKEEGRSFGVALREALKATLRESIGKAISENMTRSIVVLMGKVTDRIKGAQDALAKALEIESATAKALAAKKEAAEVASVAAGKAATLATNSNSANIKLFAISMDRAVIATEINSLALGRLTTVMATQSGGGTSDLLTAAFGAVTGAFTNSAATTGVNMSLVDTFAHGGIVNSPTLSLIGEGNTSEAIVPLPDNKSIPVKLEGSPSNEINITQSFDFRGADSATEARLRQFAAQIKAETKNEIFESINRGGSAAKSVGRR